MQEIILLGASGSIGQQTADVVRAHPDKYQIDAIAVHANIEAAISLVTEFNVSFVCIYNEQAYELFLQKYQSLLSNVTVVTGMMGLLECVKRDAPIVMNALLGSVGVLPTIEALKYNKTVAFANKETLVMAGDIVMEYAAQSRGKLLPVDSEHSAIFQCLEDNYEKQLQQIILTASGGSLRDVAKSDLIHVTKEQVLTHPNWSMGQKITVDSATMMNKGFEVIEAHHLFNLDYDQIKVILHKESKIHSMVEYVDGSILAHLGVSDMRIPIQYALTYPHRFPLTPSTAFDWSQAFALHFEPISFERFDALQMAYDAGKTGGTAPAMLNASNEIAVAAFLNGHIPFVQITEIVEKIMNEFTVIHNPTLEELLNVDDDIRRATTKIIEEIN